MKTKNHTLNSILAGTFEILVGILLLVDPIGFTSGILIAAGIALCLAGLKAIITYFRLPAEMSAVRNDLLTGLACLLLGCFCTFRSGWILAIFPILTILYGVVILITGLGKLQTTVDLIRLKQGRWYLAAISAVISLACAGVILLNPFTSTAALWIFIGLSLIVEAVLDILVAIFSRPTPPQQENGEA